MPAKSLISASIDRNSPECSKHLETGRNSIQSETVGNPVRDYIPVQETVSAKTE